MQTLPKIIIDICAHLASENATLAHPFQDGRINVSINEAQILELIRKEFVIETPKSRAWYDFSVKYRGVFYPINIKVTDTKHADNLNCKLGIYYALTGMMPSLPNETNWLDYFVSLKENLGKYEDKDYYFLVFNKSNSSDVFANTLKGLQILQPNGNNLPFQCKWGINREYRQHSFDEAKEFIVIVWAIN